MRRMLLAALLSLASLASAAQDASAFFSVCGDLHLKWNFRLPRIVFGIDWGCPPACCPHPHPHPIHHLDHLAAAAMPWYASYPAPAAGTHHHAARPMPTRPAFAQPAPVPQGSLTQTAYGYYYSAPQAAVPAYWYPR